MNYFHCFCRTAIVGAILPIFVVTSNTSAAEPDDAKTPVEVITGDQAGKDPFLGDWQGKWTKGYPPQIVAQVIPRGGDNYVINFLPAFDQRCPVFATVQAKVDEGKIRFNQDGWSGSFEGDQLTGQGLLRDKPTDFQLAKITRLSPRLGEKPPEDATVLFDGGSLDAWESDGRGGVEEIVWNQIDDFLRVWPPLTEHSFSAAVRTRKAYSDFQLHLEFRLPLIAAATGQTRGNSGIIIEDYDFFEVQVLDSYGLPGYWDDCGAIYKKESPKFNLCAPPGQWQSYDIIFHGAKLDDDGNLVHRPQISVVLNGKTIHQDVELPYSDRAVQLRREKSETKVPGRISLQHHGDPIDFRNIWIVDISR